mgnify:CR=1 FL=1
MINIKCERCSHQTPMLNLHEATDRIVKNSDIINSYHYESLRRHRNSGKIPSTTIERGIYFYPADVDDLRERLEDLRTADNTATAIVKPEEPVRTEPPAGILYID